MREVDVREQSGGTIFGVKMSEAYFVYHREKGI